MQGFTRFGKHNEEVTTVGLKGVVLSLAFLLQTLAIRISLLWRGSRAG